jgi:hypothetical protein
VKVVNESYSIDPSQPGFIRVHHVRILDSGVDMGGAMWFERANLSWVVDTLRACIDTYAFPEAAQQRGQDSFIVSESGPEQAPIISLRNRRPKDALYGGAFTLAMSKPVAEKLVAELGAIR